MAEMTKQRWRVRYRNDWQLGERYEYRQDRGHWYIEFYMMREKDSPSGWMKTMAWVNENDKKDVLSIHRMNLQIYHMAKARLRKYDLHYLE